MTKGSRHVADTLWFNVICGGLLGMLLGLIVEIFLAERAFPSSPRDVSNAVWWFLGLVVVLSGALGATIMFALNKNSELRDKNSELWYLRSYLNTFFLFADHRACVERTLQEFAVQANIASKRVIDLQINGLLKSYEELTVDETLGTEELLKIYQQIQDDADKDFHNKQAKFYETFDLVAKFKEQFFLKLKERKFKAYVE